MNTENCIYRNSKEKYLKKTEINKQYALNFIGFLKILNSKKGINVHELARMIVENKVNFNNKSGLNLNWEEKYLPLQAFETKNYDNKKAQLGIPYSKRGKAKLQEVDCSIEALVDFFTKKRRKSKKNTESNYMWQLKRGLGLTIEYLLVDKFKETFFPNLEHISTGKLSYDFLIHKEYEELAKEDYIYKYEHETVIVSKNIYYPVDLKLHYRSQRYYFSINQEYKTENKSIYNIDIDCYETEITCILLMLLEDDMGSFEGWLESTKEKIMKELSNKPANLEDIYNYKMISELNEK